MSKIAVLGPTYSFSYNLACEHYGEEQLLCMPSITEVFAHVVEHDTDRGIVPIENLIYGSVRESLINLKKYPVSIVHAYDYHIENVLASNNEHFTTIASHPQPLAQCSEFIRSHKDVKVVETSSTSKAVELASQDSSVAAIGNERAAQQYGVHVIKRSISNKDGNTTRFFEIVKQGVAGNEGGIMTSLILQPHEDRAGVLFEILSVFRIKNINLTKIESIPTGVKMNDYIFYVDIDRGVHEESVQDALNFLRTFVKDVVVLGSYSITR